MADIQAYIRLSVIVNDKTISGSRTFDTYDNVTSQQTTNLLKSYRAFHDYDDTAAAQQIVKTDLDLDA